MTAEATLAAHRDRAALIGLLGGHEPTPWRLVERRNEGGVAAGTAERLTLEGPGGPVRAFLTGPPQPWRSVPAVIYAHAHGGRYAIGAAELLEGRPALLSPYGPDLAGAGVAALCIDLPCFGERADETEGERAKRELWRGRTLFGAMLDDLDGAFGFLSRLEGVDPSRIGVMGLSMGATLGFWLAALQPRLKAVAHLCAFADLATLVESGAHDLHGIYMTVPGLLRSWSTGRVAGLAAPISQLACMGLADPLTPPEAVRIAVAEARAAYEAAGRSDAFEVLTSPATGHVETPGMRAAVLAHLRRHLQSTPAC